MDNRYHYSATETTDPELQTTLLILRCEDTNNPSRSIQVAIAPEYGSNLIQYKIGDHDVFFCDKEVLKDRRWTGCFNLWPFPNRYDREGRKEYRFEGTVISLEKIQRKEGNKPLIHGLIDDQVWHYEKPVADTNSSHVSTSIAITKDSPLFAFFPYESKITLTYTVSHDGLAVEYLVENMSGLNLPSNFAMHPYYATFGDRHGTVVCIPAQSVMKADAELLPTGELQPVEGTQYDIRQPKPVEGMMFDDVWTDLIPGEDTYVEYPKLGFRISHKVSGDFTHVVMFTHMEGNGFICLEPQTGATNAVNLDDAARETKNEQLKKAAHLIVVPAKQHHIGSVKYAIDFLK